MRSPLVGADGGMHRHPRDGLPCTSVCLTPDTCFSISGDRTGPLGAAVAIWVIFAATSPDPALRLADALAAAEPVDHVLGYCLVKALPMLLRNEYSGKHGGMWGKEKGQYWLQSTTKIEGGKASQRELWSTRKNPGIPVWSHQKQFWQIKKSTDQLDGIFKVESKFNQQASTFKMDRTKDKREWKSFWWRD